MQEIGRRPANPIYTRFQLGTVRIRSTIHADTNLATSCGKRKKRKRVAILLVAGIFTAVGRTKITPCFLRLLSAIFDSSMFAPRDLTLSSITWFSVARAVLLPYIVFGPKK
jgi:hypothetical protein